MRVRHTKLLSLLFSLTTILLHAGEIPTDTLLAHFYNRAANLMAYMDIYFYPLYSQD